MAGSESHILKEKQYCSGQSTLHLEVEGKPQVASVERGRQKNIGPAHAPRADPKGQKSEVPQSGVWDNGGNVGYTAYFNNARKTKNGELTASENEPQMNPNVYPHKDPPAQACPAPAKPEPQQEAKSAQFGACKSVGEAGYIQCFDNGRDNNKNGHGATPKPSDAPQLNQDFSEPLAKDAHSKVLLFGSWKEGEIAAYFGDAWKTKNGELTMSENVQPLPDPVESQLDQDVNNIAQPPTAAGTKFKADIRDDRVDDHQLISNQRSNYTVATTEIYGNGNPGGQLFVHQIGWERQQHHSIRQRSHLPRERAATSAWRIDSRSLCEEAPDFGDGTPLNMARFPLLNEESINSRSWHPGRADEVLAYGGSNGLKFDKRDNVKDGHSRYVTQGFPAPMSASETPLPQKAKPVQKGRSFPWFRKKTHSNS